MNVVMQNVGGQPPTVEETAEWRDSFDLSYPVLADTEGSWEGVYIPDGESFATYLIDRDGVIIWQEYGEELATLTRATEQVEAALGVR